jgi:predicted phosphatase
MSALSVLVTYKGIRELNAYIFERYMLTPNELLIPHIIFSCPDSNQIYSIMYTALRPFTSLLHASTHLVLLHHCINFKPYNVHLEVLLQGDDIYPLLIALYQRLYVLTLKSILISIILFILNGRISIETTMKGNTSQAIFVCVCSHIASTGISTDAILILNALLDNLTISLRGNTDNYDVKLGSCAPFHMSTDSKGETFIERQQSNFSSTLDQTTSWYARNASVNAQLLLVVVKELINQCLDTTQKVYSNFETQNFDIYLHCIMSSVIMDEVVIRKHVYEESEFISKLFQAYLNSGDIEENRNYQIAVFRAIKTLAMIAPIHIFHFRVFTPYFFSKIMLWEVCLETIHDMTILISALTYYSNFYDRDLNELCNDNLLKVTSLDSPVSLFWITIAEIVMRRNVSSFDYKLAIMHCIKLASLVPPVQTDLIPSNLTISIKLITGFVQYLPCLDEGEILVRTKELFLIVLDNGMLSDEKVLQSIINAIIKHELLSVDVVWNRMLYRNICLFALQRPPLHTSYAVILCRVLGYIQHSSVNLIMQTLAQLNICEGVGASQAARIALDAAALPTLSSSDSSAALNVYVYIASTLDTQNFIESRLPQDLLERGVKISILVLGTLLEFIDNPLSTLAADAFLRLVHATIRNTPSERLVQPALFSLILMTLHYAENLEYVQLLVKFTETSEPKLIEAYWKSCSEPLRLVVTIMDGMIYHLKSIIRSENVLEVLSLTFSWLLSLAIKLSPEISATITYIGFQNYLYMFNRCACSTFGYKAIKSILTQSIPRKRSE